MGKISYLLKYFRSIPYTSREVVGAFGEQGREFRPVKSAGAHCTASHRHMDVRNSAFASTRAAPAFALQFRFARLKIDCVTLIGCDDARLSDKREYAGLDYKVARMLRAS